MVVDVGADQAGERRQRTRSWQSGAALQTRVGGPIQANSRQQYMVSPDGQRFLMNTLAEETPTPITVALNF